MYVELNGSVLHTKDALHDRLADALQLPAYYGRNLDALYDLLTERNVPLEIVFAYSEDMKKMMGAYGSTLLHTMLEAENDNIALTVTVI